MNKECSLHNVISTNVNNYMQEHIQSLKWSENKSAYVYISEWLVVIFIHAHNRFIYLVEMNSILYWRSAWISRYWNKVSPFCPEKVLVTSKLYSTLVVI